MNTLKLYLLAAMLLLLALPGCSAIRAEGQVCVSPEFLKMVPFIGSNPDMTKERCVGGKVGGLVLTPPVPAPTEPPAPSAPPK